MVQSQLLAAIEVIANNREHLRQLSLRFREGREVVPWVGAGLSAPFGFPCWTPFLVTQAKQFGIAKSHIDKLTAKGKFAQAAQDIAQAAARRGYSLQIEIYETFCSRMPRAVSRRDAVYYLPQLTSSLVITTNFDRVLELAFRQQGYDVEVVSGTNVAMANLALHGRRLDRPWLFKMHGDGNDETSRVLTLEEYEAHYGKSHINLKLPIPDLLHTLFRTRTVLFLGCSLGWDRTARVLHSAAKSGEAVHFAITEKPEDEPTFQQKHDRLIRLGIRPIWYPAGQHQFIAYILSEFAAKVPTGRHPALNRQLAGAGDFLLRPEGPLFGRRAEVAELVVELERTTPGDVVVVSGPPGIGKTEVCKAALREYFKRHPRAVIYWIQDPRTQPDSVASARGHQGAVVFVDQLDETTGGAGAGSLAGILKTFSNARFLISSRERIAVAKEIVVGRLDHDSASRLFFNGSGRWSSQEARTFVSGELDCHPLAVALVASSSRQYGNLEALRKAWNETLALATRPDRPRGRLTSLETSFELSLHKVLEERRAAAWLWAALGLFPKGLSALGREELLRRRTAEERWAMRDVLVRLSIVQVDERDTFHVLGPLRKFILEKVSKGELGLSNRQTDSLYLADSVRPYFERIAGGDLTTHLAEIDNLHQFFTFANKLGRKWVARLSGWSTGFRAAYLRQPQLGQEMLGLLKTAQEQCGGFPKFEALSLEDLAVLAAARGDTVAAFQYFDGALMLFRQISEGAGGGGQFDPRRLLLRTLRELGELEFQTGRTELAHAHFQEVVEKGVPDFLIEEAIAYYWLGEINYGQGRKDAARHSYQKALSRFRGLGDHNWTEKVEKVLREADPG